MPGRSVLARRCFRERRTAAGAHRHRCYLGHNRLATRTTRKAEPHAARRTLADIGRENEPRLTSAGRFHSSGAPGGFFGSLRSLGSGRPDPEKVSGPLGSYQNCAQLGPLPREDGSVYTLPWIPKGRKTKRQQEDVPKKERTKNDSKLWFQLATLCCLGLAD